MQNELEALNQRRLATQLRMQNLLQQSAVDNEYAQALRENKQEQDLCLRLGIAPETTVSLLSQEDAGPLWDFEQYNQVAFKHEEFPLRMSAQDLSSEERFNHVMDLKQQDHAQDRAYHYLIRQGDEITGCIDLLQVQRTPDHRAQLAWHIRPGFSTQEHKTRAVQAVLNHAFYTHGLKHLQSHIAGANATAIYALEHNGFTRSTEQSPYAPAGV